MYSSLICPRLLFFFFLSLSRPAITTLEIAVYRIHIREVESAQRKTVSPALTCYTHTHAAYGGDGYRGIRARTDTQGSTLMARATGGSSKVTYPRKPHVSFPFYSVGRSRATYIYLHTFLSVTVPRPPTPTTKRTGIIWPPSLRAWQTQTAAVRHAADTEPGVCKRALAHCRYLTWVVFSRYAPVGSPIFVH